MKWHGQDLVEICLLQFSFLYFMYLSEFVDQNYLYLASENMHMLAEILPHDMVFKRCRKISAGGPLESPPTSGKVMLGTISAVLAN